MSRASVVLRHGRSYDGEVDWSTEVVVWRLRRLVVDVRSAKLVVLRHWWLVGEGDWW